MNHTIEWFNDNDGFMMGILTFIYVITTVGILLSGRKANSLEKENIVRFFRPYLCMDLYPDHEKNKVYLRIKNTGLTSAIDVSVTFDDSEGIASYQKSRNIPTKFSAIGPGVEIKFFLDDISSFRTNNKDKESFSGKLQYKGISSEYIEDINIDYGTCIIASSFK